MLKLGGSSLLMLLLPLAGAAQISFSVDTVGFPPTTVDSTRTLTLTLSNDLVVEQTVAFSGVSGPFSLSAESLTIPGESSAELEVVFSPVSVNTFTMDLTATGSAFGSDVVHISGDGTLPQAELLADTLDFGSVSVNSYATEYLPMASVGIGSLYVDSIVSSNPVISAAQGVAIAQGDTAQIPITFYSEFSGIYEVDLAIYTSDPFESVRYAHCTISAISEVGGEVCGTWSLVNSPYLLVDDVVVPDGCSLTIEPGVIILGDSLDIEVFGALYANGTAELPIDMTVGELLSHTAAENMVLTHSTVTETNEFSIPNIDDFVETRFLNVLQELDPLFVNENAGAHLGKFSEDFGDANGQGWSTSDEWNSPCSIQENFSSYAFRASRDCAGSNYYGWVYVETPVFALSNDEFPSKIACTWDTYNPNWGYNGSYIDSYVWYRINSQSDWNQLWYSTSYTNSQAQSWELSELMDVQQDIHTIQFRFGGYFRYYGQVMVDNFVFETSTYPGTDVPWSNFDATQFSDQCSSGGITLENVTYKGDFVSIGEAIEVNAVSSLIEPNSQVDKAGFGVALRGDSATCLFVESSVQGFDFDNLHVECDDFIVELTESLIGNSSQDGIDVNGNFSLLSSNASIGSNTLRGFNISGSLLWESSKDSIHSNGLQGVTVGGKVLLEADSTFVTGNGSHGIEAWGSNSDVTLYQSQLKDNGGDGIRLVGSGSDLEADYSFVRDNGGDAVEMGSSGTLRMDNCLLGYNNGYGINSSGSVDLNYMNILHNGGYGIRTSQFSTVDNSIIWFNGGVPQMITDNTYAVSYTNVQGINALLTSTDFAWGNGCIGTDPVLADDQGHLDPYSPCVDGGMPWEQDAHIPYGLGSSRADMGMYGGPANEYWGGQAPPDGAVQITDVFDIPQDQGGFVGMHFTASPFDFGGLGFNVTHYSIWRDLALGSDTPADVSTGNWEQIGTVPAQGFSQYGYTAATLVDAYPDEPACLTSFIVIAHTTDDNIYWVSDVAAACSEDNLAPAIPEFGGMVLADGSDEAIALLSWALPEEDDYAYTVVTGNNGFSGTVTNGDTLVADPSLEPGAIVAYEAVHFDIHGNASDIAALVLEAPLGEDLIPLRAGWNLVSCDRVPDAPALESLMADLAPGNLQYVIAFDAGVQFYDPDGLSFLNTLSSWNTGYGHWIKVASDDTLRVAGGRLAEDHMPGLAEGWNLVGYAAEAPAVPGAVFADLVASGDLLYVTGFDQGVEIYDPNGLPFLNTLDAMRNGFGYWVKSAVATDGDVLAPLAGDVLPAEMPVPRYDVLNGTSDLVDAAGEFVDVLNAAGTVVARIPILEGGYLMTTALFGDDPATAAVEGLTAGEAMRFAFRETVANETVEFGGDMAHKSLSLTFSEADTAVEAFPNPATEGTAVRFALSQMADVVIVMRDVQGREVLATTQAGLAAGEHTLPLGLEALQAGTYTLEVKASGVALGSTRVLVLE